MAGKSPNMMKPLILAGILVVLGGFTYWLEFGRKPKELQAEADAKKVFVLKNSAISRFEIWGASTKPENATKPPLAISLHCLSLPEKLCKTDDASKWELLEPLKTKGDDVTINSLLKNFSNLTSTETIDLGPETPEKKKSLLSDYGIDASARANPRTRKISFTLESGNQLTAYFGVKHPIGDGVFALLGTGKVPNENRILVVPDWQLAVFDQKTSYFRDKNLFTIDEKEVSSFTLTNARKIKGKLEAKRNSDKNGWQLELGSKEAEGDVDTIEGILSGATHLVAKDVIADRQDTPGAKEALLGAKNTYDLTFTAKGQVKRLRLFEKKKDPKAVATVYAIVDGQDPLFEIDIYTAEKLEKTFDEMRVGKPISVSERYSIGMIDIERRGSDSFQQHIVKELGGHWNIDGKESARGKVEAILDRLTSKVITAYSGPAPTGDILVMTFRKAVDGKTEVVAEIEFWSIKGHLYARNLRSEKKEIVELAPDFNSGLPWKAEVLAAEKGPSK